MFELQEPVVDGRARALRLFIGAGFGVVMVAAIGVSASLAEPSKPPVEEDDPPVLVELATAAPTPEPPPAPIRPSGGGGGPARPKAPSQKSAPAPVPASDAPPSSAPTPNEGSGSGSGSGSGTGTGSGSGTGTGVEPPPPPPQPPKARGPQQISEDITPPKCAFNPNQSAAQALGIEGTVVVKFTVSESGVVSDVRAVKGPPELQAIALAAVRGGSCKPATKKDDGTAVAVTRSIPIRFRFQ